MLLGSCEYNKGLYDFKWVVVDFWLNYLILAFNILFRQILKNPKTGLYFRTCEDGADWHLIPCRISPRSEFFSRAYKNWHIMWGINLWIDWPPLARGSKFHTIHIPTKATSLPPLEQWKIWTSRFRRNNINYHHHHYHHIALVARISLTLSRHSSLSFIALGRSSGQQPVSSNSCWMYVRAGRPAFARPCVGIHKSTSLMSSSLLLQQCPACLVRLTWIVFVIGGRWPYSWCLVGCCCQDLFRIARSILV